MIWHGERCSYSPPYWSIGYSLDVEFPEAQLVGLMSDSRAPASWLVIANDIKSWLGLAWLVFLTSGAEPSELTSFKFSVQAYYCLTLRRSPLRPPRPAPPPPPSVHSIVSVLPPWPFARPAPFSSRCQPLSPPPPGPTAASCSLSPCSACSTTRTRSVA